VYPASCTALSKGADKPSVLNGVSFFILFS